MMKALQLMVALPLLVTIHEFGHYIFARLFGIKVNRFYLFFNPGFSLLKYYPDKGKLELIAWTKAGKTLPGGSSEEEEKALVTFRTKKHSPVNKKGRPSWALMATSTYATAGWMIDCGCTTAVILSGSIPNSQRASMISKALLSIVAESMVIFAPMFQLGCFNASATVAFSICSRVHWRNGPPEAVIIRRRTFARSSP